MIKHKVHITTLPFGEKNIDLLRKHFDVSINSLGRKIRNEEVYEQVKNADYIMKYGILIGCHQGLNYKKIKYIHTKILNLINK